MYTGGTVQSNHLTLDQSSERIVSYLTSHVRPNIPRINPHSRHASRARVARLGRFRQKDLRSRGRSGQQWRETDFVS